MMSRLRRYLVHAFALRRRACRPAQQRVLPQWSQWNQEPGDAPSDLVHWTDFVCVTCATCRAQLEYVARDGHCPICGFAVMQSLAVASRVPRLVATSIFAMGGLGVMAMLYALLVTPSAFGGVSDPAADASLGVPVSFFVGCVVGMCSSLMVVPLLERRDLRYALPLVYGGAAIVTIAYMATSRSLYYPLDSAVPAFLSVCGLSVLAAFICPPFRVPRAGLCEGCGYDLTGNTSGVCPECGAAFEGGMKS